MLQVPLIAASSQSMGITLDGQACQISVYQKNTGIYFDIRLNGVAIKTTVLCINGMRLLEDAQYLGFVGDFVFVDTQGVDDPQYTGFGTRWQLIYLEASDLASL